MSLYGAEIMHDYASLEIDWERTNVGEDLEDFKVIISEPTFI